MSTDIDTTNNYGIDVIALQKTLKPWKGPNICLYNQQCKHMWPQGSRHVFSSAPHKHGDSERQAGGTLLSMNGKSKGRVSSLGSDPWGRFLAERVFQLAAWFAEHGATALNMQHYRKLDDEIIELTIAAAKKAGRKNFGYMRSEDLTTAGQMLILLKCLMNCKLRNQQITEGCKRSVERLDFNLDFYSEPIFQQLRKRVHKQRKELCWTIKKECKDRSIQWLEKLAEDRTRAEGDGDWQKKMNDMKCKVKEN